MTATANRLGFLSPHPRHDRARIHPPPSPMDPWRRSDITFQRMEGLVHRGLLHEWASAEEWLLHGEEDLSSPLDSYVVLFA